MSDMSCLAQARQKNFLKDKRQSCLQKQKTKIRQRHEKMLKFKTVLTFYFLLFIPGAASIHGMSPSQDQAAMLVMREVVLTDMLCQS
jgi:hypothetical protein